LVAGVADVGKSPSYKLVFVVAQQIAESGVHEQEVTVYGSQRHAVRSPVEGRREAHASLLERLGRGTALRHVKQEAMEVEGLAVGIPNHHGLVLDPEQATVLRVEAVLAREGLTRFVRPCRLAEDPDFVLRMNGVDEELRVGEPFLRAVAEDPLRLRTDVDVGAHVVDRVDIGHKRKPLDDREVLGLRGVTLIGRALDAVRDLLPGSEELELGYRRGREVLQQALVYSRPRP
jgi:hypothetical protein